MKRKRLVRLVAVTILFVNAVPNSAWAGPYGDKMTECVVASTKQEDRNTLIKWVFAALASHSAVRSLVSVTAKQGRELSVATADLFVRLIGKSCKAQARDAVQLEGPDAIQNSLSSLGQIALHDLMSDPGFTFYIGGLAKSIDLKELQALMNEP